jgi:hypothetical protein
MAIMRIIAGRVVVSAAVFPPHDALALPPGAVTALTEVMQHRLRINSYES